MKNNFTIKAAIPLGLIVAGAMASLSIDQNWNLTLVSFIIFVSTAGYIFLLERLIPKKLEWKSTRSSLSIDLKYFASTAIFDSLGRALALTLILNIQSFFDLNQTWNQHLPFWINFALANLIGELLPYFYHRVSHVGNSRSLISLALWKIHSIHHLPTGLNWFKTNWMHPVNMLLNTFLKIVPLLLLGFHEDVIFGVGVLHVVIAYLSHANILTRRSLLDYLIVTPHLHHFHHSVILDEAKNFGNILPFWDLVFGSYFNSDTSVKEVGVVKESNFIYPSEDEYLKQLRFPATIVKGCCKD
ncbi:sterol desaturase family protein [Reichenbachiella ulvae]|uniref:Sterol desaturase family protein n=1 Tax=Reichenbachiella ulvae TaxID=2980104 RepID=A0ABT3CZT6_9BACT|nr:sterol desaturase family protein [Reichenbachiella ulvae]MCV9389195.1 sterol desaturase family protein [Reichenbachiella ulvae]